MVKGSGNWGWSPGTHLQSGDSAFHRWTCASTMRRRLAWAAALRGPCAARTATAPRVLVTKLRRDCMDRSSLKFAATAFGDATMPSDCATFRHPATTACHNNIKRDDGLEMT